MSNTGRAVVLVLYLSTVLSTLSCAQETLAESENDINYNKDICMGYLSTVEKSFASGGLQALTESAYQLAVAYPTGPYISCTQVYPDITGADIRVLVNPFLPTNQTLADASTGQESSALFKALEAAAEEAMNSCCGTLVSFGLPFNQSESHRGSIVVSEAEGDFIGFAEELTDATYIFCGCPITYVPDGERNNTIAQEYLARASQDALTSDDGSGYQSIPWYIIIGSYSSILLLFL